MLLFISVYGRAAVWPTRFNLAVALLIGGVVSALWLQTRALAARVIAVFWHTLMLISITVFRGPGWVGFCSAAAIAYLGPTTAAHVILAARTHPGAAKKLAVGAIAVVIILGS
jgi:hypothetical protein